jgi:hypothetical protein
LKLKLALWVISILIVALPLAAIAVAYSGNLMDTVVPPNVKDAFSIGLSSQSSLYPKPSSASYNLQTATASFQFSFTNPLTTKITINSITADVYAIDEAKLVAHITLKEKVTVNPHGNVQLEVSGPLETGVANYFAGQIANGNSNIHVVFSNLDISAGGLLVHTSQSDAGNIHLGGAP